MSENRPLREYAPVNLDKHDVNDLVASCGDHRFRNAFLIVPRNRGVNSADEITIPGPSIELPKQHNLHYLAGMVALHDVRRLHIGDHTDCGWFKFTEEYDGETDEDRMVEIHVGKLEAACYAVHEILPHLTIVTYVVAPEELKYMAIKENVDSPLIQVDERFVYDLSAN